MLENIYNDGGAVADYIHDLKTLHEVSNFRYQRGYESNERMNEFRILDGFIWFDTRGNTMVRVSKDGYSPIHIPFEDSVCPVCGKGWNIYNIEDYVRVEDWNNRKITFYHKQCNFINNLNNKHKQFEEVFDKIYSPHDYSFKVIPNEYCQCEKCAPWFIFSTPNGEVKIGWRKRVINIEWLPSYAKFEETFADEDVTKFNRGIHAWSIEKCIEYLGRAKESIV